MNVNLSSSTAGDEGTGGVRKGCSHCFLRFRGPLPVGWSTYLASSYNRMMVSIIIHNQWKDTEGIGELTEPAMGPSWADLPFTLKVTPLGALDLTSRLARVTLESAVSRAKREKANNPIQGRRYWEGTHRRCCGRSPCSGAVVQRISTKIPSREAVFQGNKFQRW